MGCAAIAGRLCAALMASFGAEERRPAVALSTSQTVRRTSTLSRSLWHPAAAWYSRPGESPALKTGGRASRPFRRDCSQDCSQAAGQRRSRVDNCGMSAQRTDRNGRSWTTCPLLRIRRLGVRVPPSAPPFPSSAPWLLWLGFVGVLVWPHFGRITFGGPLIEPVSVAVHLSGV
jgi:hypothetical protein